MCIFFDILRFLVENKIKQKNQYSRSEPLGTGVRSHGHGHDHENASFVTSILFEKFEVEKKS